VEYVQCLREAPDWYIETVAREWGLEPKSGDEFLIDLRDMIVDPDSISMLLSGMGNTELFALKKAVVAANRDHLVSLSYLHDASDMSRRGPRKIEQGNQAVIETLLRKGLLFDVKDSVGHFYYIPPDLYDMFLEIMCEDMINSVALRTASETHVTRNELDMVNDVFALLAYVKKNELKVTASGAIYKRMMPKLLNTLLTGFTEPDPHYTATIFSGYLEYTGRFGFLYNYCFSRGLIREKSNVLVLQHDADAFVKLSLRERLRDMYYYAYQRILSANVLVAMQRLLMKFPLDTWIKVSDLLDELKGFISPREMTLALYTIGPLVIRPLLELGLIAVSRENFESIQGLEVSITPLGRRVAQGEEFAAEFDQNAQVYVQPNFEILVPFNFPHELRWKLEDIADVVKADKIVVYTISKESVLRGLKGGWGREEVIAFLEKISGNQVPQNIEFSVKDWIGNYGKVRLEKAVLLRCDDLDLAGMIRKSGQTRDFVIDVITDTDLIVDAESIDVLMAVLKKMGYPPQTKLRTSEFTVLDKKNEKITYHDITQPRHSIAKVREEKPSLYGNTRPISGLLFPTALRKTKPNKTEYETIKRRLEKTVSFLKQPEPGANWLTPLSPSKTQDVLEGAIACDHSVVIQYHTESTNTTRVRQVDPIEIHYRGTASYLVAYCRYRREERVFRIDNIMAIGVVEQLLSKKGRGK
jgi:hypothetical protein